MSTVVLDGKSAQVTRIEGTLTKGAFGVWKLKTSNDDALKTIQSPIKVAILIPSK